MMSIDKHRSPESTRYSPINRAEALTCKWTSNNQATTSRQSFDAGLRPDYKQ